MLLTRLVVVLVSQNTQLSTLQFIPETDTVDVNYNSIKNNKIKNLNMLIKINTKKKIPGNSQESNLKKEKKNSQGRPSHN